MRTLGLPGLTSGAIFILLCAVVCAPSVRAQGAPAAPGASCNEQPNTIAIADCIEGQTKLWKRRLNTAYGKLMHQVEAGQRAPLEAAQRLWVQYRDANCRFYGAEEGTIREIDAAECMRAMTEDRAKELEKGLGSN